MKKLNTQSNTKNEFKNNVMKATLIASMLAGTAVIPFSNNIKATEVIQVHAAYGDNQGGNAGGVTWGGKHFSWKLTVDGKPAYCINLGLPPTTGQEMERREDAATSNPIFKRFITAAYGRNITGLQQKYSLSDDDAWKGSLFVAHVVENLIGYGPQVEKLTEAEFRELAAQEGTVGQYAIELLEFAKNGQLPNAAIKITEPSTKLATYNTKTNRLETQVYTVNDVESTNIIVKGLSAEVYMIDAVNGQKVTALTKNQTFKLATDKLDYTAQLSQIVANAGVQDHAAVIWKYEGVQDLIQSETIDPLDSAAFTAEFKSVLGNIQFIKMNATDKKPLANIHFDLLDLTGKVIQTVKSDANGIVAFNNVLEGKYKVKEKPVVGDGIIDEELTFDVIVLPGKTVDLNGTKIVNNKENEIKFSKLDNENNKPIEGAVVTLIDKDGKVVFKGDGNSTITGIPAGKYKLKEVLAPTRFLMNEESTDVIITEDGKVSVGVIHDETRDITVTKKDGHDGKKLKGAEFELQTLDGKTLEMLDKDNNLVPAVLKTDENGEARFRGLPVGDYKVVEKTAPAGYTINSNLSVKADEKTDTKYDFVDYRIPETPKTAKIPTIPAYDFLPKTGAEIGGISIEPLIASGTGIGAVVTALVRRFKK